MRPVKRCAPGPQALREYEQARGELYDTLGRYCSYCERRAYRLHIEHIKPKEGGAHPHPELACRWDNMLLACDNCNSTKGRKCVDIHTDPPEFYAPDARGQSVCQVCGRSLDEHLSEHYWPHKDNTFRAFQYMPDGRVLVHPRLDPPEQAKAVKTLALTGLDRTPRSDQQRRDMRWNDRRETWRKAERYLCRLEQVADPKHKQDVEDSIIDLARARGYWSVWMTVFAQWPEILRRLINEFEGTCQECFDPDGQPLARSGGAL